MRLENIIATPLASGNRIKLSWKDPRPEEYPPVRVVRREGTFPVKFQPTVPEEGVALRESDVYSEMNEKGERIYCIADEGLEAETVYYYALFPYDGTPPTNGGDPYNRVAAIATGKYDNAGQMYDLLPRIYYRYDTVLGKRGEVSLEDESKGQLRRFLDLPGGQLDQLRSLAAAMPDLYNIDEVDGRLLPLLAEWIGWNTDYRREIDTQRNEIRNAPFIYQRVGLIPAIEATVKRLIGWECRTKEFVHNVFLSNNPERLTIWTKERVGSVWSETEGPLSIDWAFEGRPAAVHDEEQNIRLFYHTLRNDCWNIWSKKLVFFSIESEFEPELDKLLVSSNLRESFEENGFSLSTQAKVNKKDGAWLISDFQTYAIKKGSGILNVATWKPSEPVTRGKGFNKHPVVVLYEEKFWVFWNSFDETERRWWLQCRISAGGDWIVYNDLPDNSRERKKPWAVVDGDSNLWLFWLERSGDEWQFKYSTYNGTSWGSVQSFPADSRVEADPFVLFHPSDRSIWVFWARKEPVDGTGQKRWKILYRKKVHDSDWGDFQALEIHSEDYDDREPSAFVNADGNIELFWSSKRDGSWSIWSALYDNDRQLWGTPVRVTEGPYSQHDPVPVLAGNGMLLFYRSNQSVTYPSNVYGATETVDFRNAGSTTFDTQNLRKKELRGEFEDFQAYSYDTGKADEDWYARDSVGVFMTPGTFDQTLINSNVDTLRNLLREFLPIQVRPVFFIETPLYREMIYTCDFPSEHDQRRIREMFIDDLTASISDEYTPLGDFREDTVLDWIWLRTVDCINQKYFDHQTVNFHTLPISTKFRTWHTALKEGG